MVMDNIIVDEKFVKDMIKERPTDCNKGDFGRLLNIAGSANYIGAAYLSSRAAQRCGVGYTVLLSTPRVCESLISAMPGCVLLPVTEGENGGISSIGTEQIERCLSKMTAVSIGCGMGDTADTRRIMNFVLAKADCPVVIDADGINTLARDKRLLEKLSSEVVLTPHLGELSRLLNIDVNILKNNIHTISGEFAVRYGLTLLVKGSTTTVFSPNGEYYTSSSGCPGMAKAGSGDVLTGILGALLAQGIKPKYAAACAAYIHGAAGSDAAAKYSQTAMLATDIINELPAFFLKIER